MHFQTAWYWFSVNYMFSHIRSYYTNKWTACSCLKWALHITLYAIVELTTTILWTKQNDTVEYLMLHMIFTNLWPMTSLQPVLACHWSDPCLTFHLDASISSHIQLILPTNVYVYGVICCTYGLMYVFTIFAPPVMRWYRCTRSFTGFRCRDREVFDILKQEESMYHWLLLYILNLCER